MNKLLQSCTFRNQLRTLAADGHEGQDGQQVIGATGKKTSRTVLKIAYAHKKKEINKTGLIYRTFWNGVPWGSD